MIIGWVTFCTIHRNNKFLQKLHRIILIILLMHPISEMVFFYHRKYRRPCAALCHYLIDRCLRCLFPVYDWKQIAKKQRQVNFHRWKIFAVCENKSLSKFIYTWAQGWKWRQNENIPPSKFHAFAKIDPCDNKSSQKYIPMKSCMFKAGTYFFSFKIFNF